MAFRVRAKPRRNRGHSYASQRYTTYRPLNEMLPTVTAAVIEPEEDTVDLTYSELVIACKNVGVNLECGRVASIFYTGGSNVPCDCGGCHIPYSEQNNE